MTQSSRAVPETGVVEELRRSFTLDLGDRKAVERLLDRLGKDRGRAADALEAKDRELAEARAREISWAAKLVEATLQAEARIAALANRLGGYAITEEYDFPGDAPEFCGFWCNECKEHVEADGSGHQSTCLCHGVQPTTPRATRARTAVGSGREGGDA